MYALKRVDAPLYLGDTATWWTSDVKRAKKWATSKLARQYRDRFLFNDDWYPAWVSPAIRVTFEARRGGCRAMLHNGDWSAVLADHEPHSIALVHRARCGRGVRREGRDDLMSDRFLIVDASTIDFVRDDHHPRPR